MHVLLTIPGSVAGQFHRLLTWQRSCRHEGSESTSHVLLNGCAGVCRPAKRDPPDRRMVLHTCLPGSTAGSATGHGATASRCVLRQALCTCTNSVLPTAMHGSDIKTLCCGLHTAGGFALCCLDLAMLLLSMAQPGINKWTQSGMVVSDRTRQNGWSHTYRACLCTGTCLRVSGAQLQAGAPHEALAAFDSCVLKLHWNGTHRCSCPSMADFPVSARLQVRRLAAKHTAVLVPAARPFTVLLPR